jgi:hypothetical protein
MQTFQALSYGEGWRVTRLVARGKAPKDPRMAAAAVELAESYRRKERGETMLHRGLAVALILGGTALAILAAVDGDALLMSAMALVVLTNVAQLAFNPMARPQSVGLIPGSIATGFDPGKLTRITSRTARPDCD